MLNEDLENNLSQLVVMTIITVILVSVVMTPIINDLAEDKEITTEYTLTNTGDIFALTDDSATHTITMGLFGDNIIVTADGEIITTGMNKILPDTIGTRMPFGIYYGAINLASGSNSDDAGETRLSTVKGEVAYVLDPMNLHQTKAGYTFDPTLYNVMMIIPPVYWYSDTANSILYMASSPDAFVSQGISADLMKDYAHTYTVNGTVGHAPAIAIGVYEAYNDNGVLTSQSGRTPTANISLTNFVPLATAGNTDNTAGTYELWNYYMWTLYRIMGWTVMGNMDSQYMMGNGPVSNSASSVTGLTDSFIQKSPNSNDSVCLLIENSWGSLSEWIGDVKVSAGQYSVGNALGGSTSASAVVDTLAETVTGPSSSGYYATFNPVSDAFGTATSVTSSISASGQNINDYYYYSSSSTRALHVGGGWGYSGNAGLSYAHTINTWPDTHPYFGSRLAYVFADSYVPPDGAEGGNFAYTVTYSTTGTISDVTSDGISYMPDGTTLNEYWTDVEYALPPTIGESTAHTTLVVGSSAILQLYNSGHAVVQTSSETVSLGRITSDITVTVSNGILTVTDDNNISRTFSIYAFRSAEGTLVRTTDAQVLLTDIIAFGDYAYGMTATEGTVDIGYTGASVIDNLSVTVLNPSDTVSTNTVSIDAESNEYYSTVSGITFDTAYSDSTSSSTTYTEFIVPATATYTVTEIIKGMGISGKILLAVPVLVLLSLIIMIGSSYYSSKQ